MEHAWEPSFLEDDNNNPNNAESVTAELRGPTRTDEQGQSWMWNAAARIWVPQIDEKLLEEQQKAYAYTPAADSTMKPPSAPVAAASASSAASSSSLNSRKPPHADEDSESEDNSSSAGDETKHTSATAAVPSKRLRDETPEQRTRRLAKKRARRALKETEESSVYVTGLPPDVTQEQLTVHMNKCGFVKRDAHSGEWKCRMHRAPDGALKGDATVTYLKKESVALALQNLDDSYITPTHRIRVTRAQFDRKQALASAANNATKAQLQQQQAGDGTDAAAAAKKNRAKRRRMNQLRELSWDERETRKHVVLFNCFDPLEMHPEGPQYFTELRDDIMEECAQRCGEVEVCKVFEKHPQGVVVLKFRQSDAAQRAIELLNTRFFGGRQLKAEWYDGVTNYAKQTAQAPPPPQQASHQPPHQQQRTQQQQQRTQQQQELIKSDAPPTPPQQDDADSHRIDEFGKWLEEGSSSSDEEPDQKPQQQQQQQHRT